ncbi:MAG TPA: MFS transporter [Vicinamibacterales bacterium]|nr:MFS transporter [Vicinamibacterales bacterium]
MSSLLDRVGLGRPELRAWALYDLANSAYQTTIIASVFPIYFRRVLAADLPEAVALSRFAWASAIAVLVVAVLAPLLGAIADHAAIKKRLLAMFAGTGIASCFAMFWLTEGEWLFALVLFVIGNIGVAGSIVFYESLLPHLVGPSELDRVSTAGYAIGFLGGGTLLAINLLMIQRPALFGLADAGAGTRLALASVGLWWLIFSIPLLVKVPEPAALAGAGREPASLTAGARHLAATFRELRKYRSALMFLLAFFVYNDGIQTMIKMAAIYGDTIGLESASMITALLLTQFIGVPAAFGFGALAGRLGAKAAVYLGLAVYILTAALAYYMTTAYHFYALAVLVGLVQGGTQALSRSIFASMIPRQKSSEFFAFFGVFERYAGVLGPAVFAIVVSVSGRGRAAILAVLLFFIVGAILLTQVDVDGGRREARAGEEELATAH